MPYKNIEKKFAWSFLGFVLAAIFGSISIYTEFVRDDTPELVVEILNETNVLDVKEDIRELKIFYGDEDIKSLNKTLSVISLRIKNIGRSPILISYYDNKYPLNLSIENGTFLRAELTGATNKYLISEAIPTIKTQQLISLPNVILENGEGYIIKVLILQTVGADAGINISGKVARVKELKVLKSDSIQEKTSFWKEVFSGDWQVNIVRLPVYFFLFMLSLALILIPLGTVQEKVEKMKREKLITQFKAYQKENVTPQHEKLFDMFIKHGMKPIVGAKETISISDDDNIKEDGLNGGEIKPPRLETRTGRLLKSINAFSEDEHGNKEPNPEALKLLEEFIDFIVIKQT